MQIGNLQLSQAELLPLLKRYRILPGVLRELVFPELTIDRAIADVECSEEEKKIAIQKCLDRHQLTSNEKIQQWLIQQCLNYQQMEEITVRDFKIEKFKQQNFTNKVNSYFLNRKGQLDRAIYSLFRTSHLGTAQEIYFRLVDGEATFAEIAKQYSQGAESKTDGLVGPAEIGTLHPVIAKLIATHPLGQICQPIQLEGWYTIVRPEELISARLDEVMHHRLINELFNIWVSKQMKLASIPDSAPISLTE